ncbi:hypothetical protein K7432_010923 [Basidiobolus ranarum]|uniref:Uncharacterized protein n=1 Tax=Basidiobolus ranarum TaxID=34480 RepID=A0ABR2WMZ8_9FUNG
MKSFFAYALTALIAQVAASPSSLCRGWTVSPLQHTLEHREVFAANEQVTLKWNTRNSQIQYITDIGLFSAKTNEFLHTQYRSYPGVNAASGEISFTLSVPLCLQREGEYYLGVYASTPGENADCSLETRPFKFIADPNGNYTVCNL